MQDGDPGPHLIPIANHQPDGLPARLTLDFSPLKALQQVAPNWAMWALNLPRSASLTTLTSMDLTSHLPSYAKGSVRVTYPTG